MTYDINDILLAPGSPSQDQGCGAIKELPDGVVGMNVTLHALVEKAYGLCGAHIVDLPLWDKTTVFSVKFMMAPEVATAFQRLSNEEKRMQREYMLQVALLGYFNLSAHTAKVDEYECRMSHAARISTSTVAEPTTSTVSHLIATPHRLTAQNISMSQLASQLGDTLGIAVTDKTDLSRPFNIDIALPSDDINKTTGATRLSAIELWLRDHLSVDMRPTGQSIDTIRIDHVQLPIQHWPSPETE